MDLIVSDDTKILVVIERAYRYARRVLCLWSKASGVGQKGISIPVITFTKMRI